MVLRAPGIYFLYIIEYAFYVSGLCYRGPCSTCQDTHLPSSHTAHLRQVKMKNQQCLGLVVRSEHAKLFLAPEDQRKRYELRSKPIRFIQAGERVALLSCGQGPRICIGVLQFEGNVKIPDLLFEQFASLHRVEREQYNQLKSSWRSHQDCCWAWHFELVHVFTPGLVVRSKLGSEVWMYFHPVEDVQSPGETAFGRPDSSKSLSEGCGSDEILSSIPTKRSLSSQSGIETPSGLKRMRTTPTLSCTPQGESEGQLDLSLTDEPVDSVDPCDEIEDTQQCLILQKEEWRNLFDSCFLLRPFRTLADSLVVLMRERDHETFWAVGRLHLDSSRLISTNADFSSCTEMYTQQQLRAFKNQKKTWRWEINSIDVFDRKSAVAWVSSTFKNRVFSLPTTALSGGDVKGPENLDVAHTAQFFLSACCREPKLAELLSSRNLDGKCIRIATTCSGSDVCVNVLQQTLSFLGRRQARSAVLVVQFVRNTLGYARICAHTDCLSNIKGIV